MDADSPFTTATLEALYAAISSPDGVTIAELRALVGCFTTRPVADADLQAYREGRKPWKRLREEVVPVEHFLSATYPDDARVRFPLNDQPTDAWLTVDGGTPVGIEVTGALARAGIEVGKSLAGGGAVPGFIALQDDAKKTAFAEARARGRIMHSAKGVDQTIDQAIKARMAGKDKSKFAGQILLITAPIGSSPKRSADDLKAAHLAAATALPFAKVFVADSARGSAIVQLK